MCGIAGAVDFRGTPPSTALLLAMEASLAHRGPDASGHLVEGACGLAHTRLSIIDVAGSPQPMRVADSPVLLSYNGELYNYRELKRELESGGARFETAGDTEVILRWLERDWADAPRRFDGMFGFAAWDRRRERLLLGRDPVGIKPLFYATPAEGLLVFGSEIKALLRHPEIDVDLDEDALRQALRFRAVYGARTLYRGVRQLEPGCTLEFSREGVRVARYWDLGTEVRAARERSAGDDPAVSLARAHELLVAAVRKRLIADVPVGAFLSGGIDSSLIVALIKEARGPDEDTHTFSVGFAGDPHGELPFAGTVARHLGTKHTEVRLSEADYAARFLPMTTIRDAPISEPADLAISRMSEVARETVKVVLSGEGADEVFCGYPKYGFARVPAPLRAVLRVLGPSAVARLGGLVGVDARRARVAARALGQPRELDRLAQWFSDLERDDLSGILPRLDWSDGAWEATLESQREALERFGGGGPLLRMQAVDCLTWLPGNLLERGDRMTMAAGLELRVPFLDRALVPAGFALPDRQKVRGRSLKWAVRQWASQRLPPEIVRRPKWGFRVPLADWFRGSLREMLHDHLRAAGGLCGRFGDRDAVEALLAAHDAGRVDASLALWTLLASEVWYQGVFSASRTLGNDT